MLLGASVVFYIWGAGGNVATIIYICAVGFGGGLAIAATGRKDARGQRMVVWIVVAAAAVPILLQKYLPVVLESVGSQGVFTWPLALGVSFITFHSISYLVDVKRGKIAAERKVTDFFLYLFLFPHQIAGPIVRYSEIVDELKRRPRPSGRQVAYGSSRFAWGLFKKTCIADNVAVIVATIDALPAPQQSATTAWLVALAFALQIYFDFSGYSDMAIGIAAILGFHFPENFAGPYRSVSVTEFWRRWHMTLSRWFRDYVYIPLGGNRLGRRREYVALIVTFSLTALWHGATLPFLIWGLIHSCALIGERVTGLRDSNRALLARRLLMAMFIVVSWVPFHARHLSDAVDQWKRMASLRFGQLPPDLILALTPLVVAALLIAMATFVFPKGRRTGFDLVLGAADGERFTVRPALAASIVPVLAVVSVVVITWQEYSPFLYFAF